MGVDGQPDQNGLYFEPVGRTYRIGVRTGR